MPSRTELIEWLDSQRGYSEEIVDALLARWPHIAGPERVESVEELDALPDGSIVLDAEGYAARVYRDAHELAEVAYPAVVLHRPDATNPEEGRRDDESSLNTFGQHHPVAGWAADALTTALDGEA